MFKIIKFSDTIAIWSNEVLNVSTVTFRYTPKVNRLPNPQLLEFRCSESELYNASESEKLFTMLIQQFYVPDVQLHHK